MHLLLAESLPYAEAQDQLPSLRHVPSQRFHPADNALAVHMQNEDPSLEWAGLDEPGGYHLALLLSADALPVGQVQIHLMDACHGLRLRRLPC